nr:hypothetical protein [Tanacetum cinerariifolium]
MVRDSVQLETTINTISYEYLLDFTLEYGIPETLHPELPGPGDRIVDFPEGKVGVYTRNGPVQFDSCSKSYEGEDWEPPPCPHEVPLLTLTATRVIEMDEPTVATDSSGVPSTIERGNAAPEMPLPEDVPTTTAPGADHAGEAVAAEPPATLESRKRGHDGTNSNALAKSLRRDHADLRPSGSSRGEKSLAAMQLCLASNVFMSEGVPADVSDPDPLAFADAPSPHPADVAHLLKVLLPPGTRSLRMFLLLLKLGLREAYTCQNRVSPMVARQDQRIQARESKIKNLEALLETEVGMKRAAEEKSARLSQELKRMRAQFLELQVSNKRLSQQVDTLQQQVSGKEILKAAFEEYKQQQDQLVEQRCTEMDARLDALSIDFDEELYPHMLIAIAGRRWVIGQGLRLAMMNCAESLKMRQRSPMSDGVLVSVPTVVPQGLALLLVDAATQTDLEDV